MRIHCEAGISESEEERAKRMMDTVPETATKTSKKYWIFFWCCCLVGTIYGIWRIGSMLNAPKSAVVKEIPAKYALSNPDIPPTLTEFQGTYASFFLPDSYEEKRHEVFEHPSGVVLEQAYFTQLRDPGRKMALTIERVDGGQAENTSSYLLRMNNPKLYTKQYSVRNGKQEILFFKNEAVYEILGYMKKDDLVAEFALSSAVEAPEKLMPDFLELWKNIQWADPELSKKK
jgi:hypothetical protein